MKILEQFWNEALNSNKIKKPSHPQYNELLDAADKTEKKLLSLLNEEGKELYYKMNEIAVRFTVWTRARSIKTASAQAQILCLK